MLKLYLLGQHSDQINKQSDTDPFLYTLTKKKKNYLQFVTKNYNYN